ncbi:MAG TPA: chloride channel protein [Egibacteraceae bacterium]|nr:chloride channel protein [Egibacteraceae bacterium]
MTVQTLTALDARLRRLRGAVVSRTRGETIMLALAAGVGLATGLLAVALIELISMIQGVAFGLGGTGPAAVVAVPTLGGMVVGLLLLRAPEAAGGGVTQLMRSIALEGGRMPARTPAAKLLASGTAIGTGASGGREGPIVQIGGSIGSLLGRLFALDDERMRTLIAAGAAGGIAASFNAPIGGMLFALEVIVGGFKVRSLQVVVVASVVASVTARQLIGDDLIYSPPPHELAHPGELALYVLLGVAAVAAGLALARGELLVGAWSERTRLPLPMRTAAGGLGVGIIALALPEVLGTGDHLPPIAGAIRNPIAQMLEGGFGVGFAAVGILLALMLGKIAATSLSIGTGNSVGSFGPAVFIGAALGGALGHGAATLLPHAGIEPGAFALVGLAAVLGSSARAPLTGILIAFELTGDYGLVLPLMLATGIATFLADRIQRGSIYTLPLLAEGIVYAEPEDIDIMQTVRVAEIMTSDPDTVQSTMPVSELREHFRRTRHHGFPVLDGQRLIGIVTLSDLTRAAGADTGDVMSGGGAVGDLTVGDICTRRVLSVTPDDPVFRALRRMAAGDVGRLPVVAADDHGRLVGLMRRADIVRAYDRAVTRSLGVQQRRESSRLRDLGGVQFVELVIHPTAPVVSDSVRQIPWPKRTILTSIRRSGELIMPNGDTVLEAGDAVTVLTDRASAAEVRRLLSEPRQG